MHHSIDETMLGFPLPINLTLTDVAEIIIGFYFTLGSSSSSSSELTESLYKDIISSKKRREIERFDFSHKERITRSEREYLFISKEVQKQISFFF